MFKIVRSRTLRSLHNRAEIERIKRVAADHTCTQALFLLEEWDMFGYAASGGYSGTLVERTRGLTGGRGVPVPGQEFAGITTAPNDPSHVGQVIDHIAHLEEEQVADIRFALKQWGTAAHQRASHL